MTYYNRFTPYLLSSSLPDRSSNSLSLFDSEDFTGTKVFEISGSAVGYDLEATDGYTSYALPGWTDHAATLAIQNTGTVKLWLYFNPADEGANYANTQFITVEAGRSAVVSFDSQYYGPLFNNGATFDQEQVIYIESGDATTTATFDMTLLGT